MNPSKEDKKDKTEFESKKSDLEEGEVKKWKSLLSESLKNEAKKDKKIIGLEKQISELEAQISHLKNKNE